jgi:hypothetical protein
MNYGSYSQFKAALVFVLLWAAVFGITKFVPPW